MINLQDWIVGLLKRKGKEGLDLTLLEPHTKLLVETRHSVYEIETIQKNAIFLLGGSTNHGLRFETPVSAIFIGSSFGASLLKINWIGKGMQMEMFIKDRTLFTSAVQGVTVIGPDKKWQYCLDWKKD